MTAATPLTRALAQTDPQKQELPMNPGAFVYTEVQISVPFSDAPWPQVSDAIRQQPGFLNKTWLSGLGTNSLGGFYAFDNIENAQRFVTGYFPAEARGFGVAHTTRVFDAASVSEASLDLGSPHFGAKPTQTPGAFVYTEVQVSVPFDQAPWRDRNRELRKTPGLISKTWLSGINTHTLGGIDAFDTLENATAFAIDAFPQTAAGMNAAFYTRVFDARTTETASRSLNSPYNA
ncbi:MAG: hypothetical protein HKO95_01055 [Rhodobacteraceae bacterium]|nr:hypothetical protein [Paracoccaceae bacterium]